jgi:hypothetical protein
MNEDIVNAGFDAQSPEPENSTNDAKPNLSENTAEASDQQGEPDPAQILWQSLNEDPIGTISFLAQHYGLQPNQPTIQPQQQLQAMHQQAAIQQPNEPDPWQQLILNVALRMWQSEAAAVVKSRAQEDGLELSDQDLQSIFLSALERYAGDIDSAYAAFAYPRLKARASNQKQQSAEEKEPDSGDLMSSIIMAGYR